MYAYITNPRRDPNCTDTMLRRAPPPGSVTYGTPIVNQALLSTGASSASYQTVPPSSDLPSSYQQPSATASYSSDHSSVYENHLIGGTQPMMQSEMIRPHVPAPEGYSYAPTVPMAYPSQSEGEPHNPSSLLPVETKGTMRRQKVSNKGPSISQPYPGYVATHPSYPNNQTYPSDAFSGQDPSRRRAVHFRQENEIVRFRQENVNHSEDKNLSIKKSKSHPGRHDEVKPHRPHSEVKQHRPHHPSNDPPNDLPPEQDDFLSQIFSNTSNILTKMAIGAVAGACYGGFQNMSAQKMISYKLHPNPERFDLDIQMSKLFFRLDKYRKYHEEAYCRALNNTDRLFLHEASIRRKGPKFGDISLSKSLIMDVVTDLNNFKVHVTDAKDRSRFNILDRAIKDRLLKHHANIVRRCSVIRPRIETIKRKMERNPYHYACADYQPSSTDDTSTVCEACSIDRKYHRVYPTDDNTTGAPSTSHPNQTEAGATKSSPNTQPNAAEKDQIIEKFMDRISSLEKELAKRDAILQQLHNAAEHQQHTAQKIPPTKVKGHVDIGDIARSSH
jgi:hypothetical protein